MTAATTDRNTQRQYVQRQIGPIPLANAGDIPAGVMVMVVSATGTLINAADAAGGLVMGLSPQPFSYAGGDRQGIAERCVAWLVNDGTIAAANIGMPCEVKDNVTVSLTTTTNHIPAGTIEGVDATLGVLVSLLGGVGPRGATGPAGP